MNTEPEPMIDKVNKELASLANHKNSLDMKKYMRNKFIFFGIRSKALGLVTKNVSDQLKDGNGETLLEFVDYCWDQSEREYQYLGADLLKINTKKLKAEDLDTIKFYIMHKSWWDTIDNLAPNPLGFLMATYPEHLTQMDKWIKSDNIWLARSAIIFQLKYKKDTDFERLKEYILLRADDKEFFIRKASGWALRQYSKVNPDAVVNFVNKNESVLSGLTKREALKVVNRTTKDGS